MGNAVPAKSPIARTEARDGSQEQRGAMQFQENRPTMDTDETQGPGKKKKGLATTTEIGRSDVTKGNVGNAVPTKSADHTDPNQGQKPCATF